MKTTTGGIGNEMKEEPERGNDENAGNESDQGSPAEEDLPEADQGLPRNMMILIVINNYCFLKNENDCPAESNQSDGHSIN